jgi:outer membrane protein assembly factor BamB
VGGSSTPSAPPTVYRGFAYGVAGGTGRLYAYRKSDGAIAWSYLGGTSLGSVSPVSPGADGILYFSDSANNEFVAIDPSTGTPTTSPTGLWRFKGPTGVALSGVGTEATIDAKGILYFGQDSGDVYALITDVGDPTPPTGLGADWPRTGFDRCNSSNASFACQ